MRRLSGALLLIVVGCTATSLETTTTSVEPPTTTSTTGVTSTTVPEACPPPPYEIGFFPPWMNSEGVDPSGIEPDVWTSVGGTQTTFYGRNVGSVAIALIRGTLPPVDWPGEKGTTTIDGTDAVAGMHLDGTWVVAWFEEPADRCDLYTMVFYPPWDQEDVGAVVHSMDRVGG